MSPGLLTVDTLTGAEVVKLLDAADELKADQRAGAGVHTAPADSLRGLTVGLLFEQPSVAARASFEVAVRELGGNAVTIDGDALPAAEGDALADAVRLVGCYVDGLVVRTGAHSRLEAIAAASGVPVLNARSSFAHPCQALADLQTIREYKGTLDGLKLAYLGDGDGVANSLLRAGAMVGLDVAVASPPGYGPIPQVVDGARATAARSGATIHVTANPLEAARDADVVYTDGWVAPGREAERDARMLIFRPFQVGYHVMEAARPDAIVMHGLPARRGEEIAADVLDGQQSVVWAQAENRLHTQKALLAFMLTGRRRF